MAINNPNIIELSQKVDSRYTLCILAAKRAREIIAGKPALTEGVELKPLKTAVLEINNGFITYERNSKEEF